MGLVCVYFLVYKTGFREKDRGDGMERGILWWGLELGTGGVGREGP